MVGAAAPRNRLATPELEKGLGLITGCRPGRGSVRRAASGIELRSFTVEGNRIEVTRFLGLGAFACGGLPCPGACSCLLWEQDLLRSDRMRCWKEVRMRHVAGAMTLRRFVGARAHPQAGKSCLASTFSPPVSG